MTIMVMCVNAPAPLIEYFRKTFHLNYSHISMMYGGYSLIIIICLPFSGKISDSLGRKKSILCGLGFLIIGTICITMANNFSLLVIGRAIQGLAVATMSAPCASALAETQPIKPANFGAMASTLAMAIGASLGLLWVGGFSELPLHQLKLPISLILPVMLAIISYCLVLSQPNKNIVKSNTLHFIKIQDLKSEFWISSLTVILAFGIQSTLFTMSGPRFAQSNPDHAMLSASLAMTAFMVTSGIGMIIGRTLKSNSSMIFGNLLLPIGLAVVFLIGNQLSLWFIMLSILISGLGHGMAYVGALSVINKTAPPDNRGLYTSLFFIAIYVGGGGPVMLLGLMAENYGFDNASIGFVIISVMIALGLVGWLRKSKETRQS